MLVAISEETVNKSRMKGIYILILLVSLLSCQNTKSLEKNNSFQNIDYSVDTPDYIYKLRILDDVDDKFYDDKYGYTKVKSIKRLFVEDSCFGNYCEKNVELAKKYASKKGFPDVLYSTLISLPTKNQVYKTVWRVNQFLEYDLKDKRYYTFDIATIELRQGEIKYKGKTVRCLKIMRQDPDEEDCRFNIQTLNFIKTKNYWELGQRERISITENLQQKREFSYCFDTICIFDYTKKGEFDLNRDHFFDSKNMECLETATNHR